MPPLRKIPQKKQAEESPLALAAGKGHKDAVVFLQGLELFWVVGV